MATTRSTPGRLDTDPLTINQLGRIHQEFSRLGFGRTDRAERLRITGLIAKSGPIESTKELRMGEAGRAIKALTRCETVRELYEITEDRPGILSLIIGWIFK